MSKFFLTNFKLLFSWHNSPQILSFADRIFKNKFQEFLEKCVTGVKREHKPAHTFINSNMTKTIAPWPYFSEEEISAVKNVLLSGKVNYWTGDECKTFEKEFASYVGRKYAIALANGSLALELALIHCHRKTRSYLQKQWQPW